MKKPKWNEDNLTIEKLQKEVKTLHKEVKTLHKLSVVDQLYKNIKLKAENEKLRKLLIRLQKNYDDLMKQKLGIE